MLDNLGGAAREKAPFCSVPLNSVDLVKIADGASPVAQAGANFERVVNAGRVIGTGVATGQPTAIYTVITDALGNLVTMFPGRPR